MMLADPLRLACPRCGATLYQRQLWSGNTLGARYYSDRKREAPMLPSFPSFSKCPKCGELFWVRDLKPSEDPDAPQWGPSEAYLENLDLEDSVRFLEEKTRPAFRNLTSGRKFGGFTTTGFDTASIKERAPKTKPRFGKATPIKNVGERTWNESAS